MTPISIPLVCLRTTFLLALCCEPATQPSSTTAVRRDPPSLASYDLWRIYRPQESDDPQAWKMSKYSLPEFALDRELPVTLNPYMPLIALSAWKNRPPYPPEELLRSDHLLLFDALIPPPSEEAEHEIVVAGIVSIPKAGDVAMSYVYIPDAEDLGDCGQGFARYRLFDLQRRTKVADIDCCWHSLNLEFSGFLTSPSVLGYLIKKSPKSESEFLPLKTTLYSVSRDGALTLIPDLSPTWISAPADGTAVLLINLTPNHNHLDMEMKSPNLHETLWKRRVPIKDHQWFGGIDIVWSDDGRLICIQLRARTEWTEILSADDGRPVYRGVPKFGWLRLDGPATLVRKDTSFDPYAAFGVQPGGAGN